MGAIFTTKSTKTIDISLRVNGKLHRVSFMPSVLFGVKGESLYSTADDVMVQALKNHKYYGVYFFLKSEDSSTTSTEAVEPAKPTYTSQPEIGKAYKRRVAREKKRQEKIDLAPVQARQPQTRSIRYDNVKSALI